MKAWIVSLLTAAVAAAPTPQSPLSSFGSLFGGGPTTTANELDNGPCKAVFYIVARGSTEPGNIVRFPASKDCRYQEHFLSNSYRVPSPGHLFV
jgi:hypothetical protein